MGMAKDLGLIKEEQTSPTYVDKKDKGTKHIPLVPKLNCLVNRAVANTCEEADEIQRGLKTVPSPEETSLELVIETTSDSAVRTACAAALKKIMNRKNENTSPDDLAQRLQTIGLDWKDIARKGLISYISQTINGELTSQVTKKYAKALGPAGVKETWKIVRKLMQDGESEIVLDHKKLREYLDEAGL
jgi:SOS response regulatory protein OraA/RecX